MFPTEGVKFSGNNSPMMKLWRSAEYPYIYDPTRGLLEQIEKLVDDKLKWYSEILARYPFFNYDNWKDKSLNVKFGKITTITHPKIEEAIAASTNDKETFEKIVWLIPYFVWRDPNVEREPKTYKPTQIKEIVKICKPYMALEPIWAEEDKCIVELKYYGEHNDIIYKKIEFENPSLIDKTLFNENLMWCKIICTGETLTDISKLFKNCKKIKIVDLSECCLRYCSNMSETFNNCINLKIVDFSNIDIHEYIDVNTSMMFDNTPSLQKIIMSNTSDYFKNTIQCAVRDRNIEIIY